MLPFCLRSLPFCFSLCRRLLCLCFSLCCRFTPLCLCLCRRFTPLFFHLSHSLLAGKYLRKLRDEYQAVGYALIFNLTAAYQTAFLHVQYLNEKELGAFKIASKSGKHVVCSNRMAQLTDAVRIAQV